MTNEPETDEQLQQRIKELRHGKADTINLPDNMLQAGIAEYSPEDQDALLWIFAYADRELGGSRSRLTDKLQVDWSTLYRVATGTYPASISNIVEKIQRLRGHVLAGADTTFVETRVTKKIFETLDYAHRGDASGGRMVMILGPSRRGKTEAIQEWCRRNNHGASVYLDVPGDGGYRSFLQELARGCRIGRERSTSDLRDRIVGSFNSRRILVADEFARLMINSRTPRFVEMDFIRRLHDVTRCAVVISATTAFDHMLRAPAVRDYMEQFIGRIEDPLVLPDKIFRDETRAICRHFAGETPSDDLVDLAHQVANGPGKLGTLFPFMRQAAALARAKKKTLGEAELRAAVARRQARITWSD